MFSFISMITMYAHIVFYIIVASVMFSKYSHHCRCKNNKQLAQKRIQLMFANDKTEEISVVDYNEMVVVHGGKYNLTEDNEPSYNPMYVKVKDFLIDKFPVTVKEFYNFVSTTGYVTFAERNNESYVYDGYYNSYNLKKITARANRRKMFGFLLIEGANWYQPEGPFSNIIGRQRHPVTHVTYADATLYCKWRRARLPTSSEWLAACLAQNKHPPTTLQQTDKNVANFWDGDPIKGQNIMTDGYYGTSPVDLYEKNEIGIYDMVGNVWEWTTDLWDLRLPDIKMVRGSSHLAHAETSKIYHCWMKNHFNADISVNDLGFRCAKTIRH